MWPLPEPTRPAGATRWDPPVLVRLELDHGLEAQRPRSAESVRRPSRQAWRAAGGEPSDRARASTA